MSTTTSHSTQAAQQKHNAQSGSGLTMDAITLEVTDGAATRRILNEVSLHIAPGELVGITGPSGSGKSTLLSVAGCLQEPTSGEAVLTAADSGEELTLTGHSAREAARIRREHIGIVFQQPNLLPSLRVKDQLMAMLHLGSPWPLQRKAKQAASQRADELLDAVRLGGLQQRKVGEL